MEELFSQLLSNVWDAQRICRLSLFFGIYYDHNDSNIYIEYHILPKTANLQGGNTRNTCNLAYHQETRQSTDAQTSVLLARSLTHCQ